MTQAGARTLVIDRSIGEIAAASDMSTRRLLAAVRVGDHYEHDHD